MSFNDYFNFSKGQAKAVILLVTLILISTVIYFLLPQWITPNTELPSDELKTLMSQIQEDSSATQNSYGSTNDRNGTPSKLTPFNFDPNTLDEAGFKRLGLRDKLVATILNFRNKGGKFYNKESLKRIYGLHEDEYAQLEPYISIPGSNQSRFEQKPKEYIQVELNSADTAQLVKLRGIGSKLSMNIVKYRSQLGGFAGVEQLKEVFGISPDTYENIKGNCTVNKGLIRKLNLNEATYNELNVHPYLKGDIAKAIADYRKAKNYHIDNLQQLKEIQLINEEIFRKIAPYLSIQ